MEMFAISLALCTLFVCLAFGNCDGINHTESFDRYKICMHEAKDPLKCKDGEK